MKKQREGFPWYAYIALCALTFGVLTLCVGLGSVSLPFSDTLTVIWHSLWGLPMPEGLSSGIIIAIRLPRVICVALVGAALALCGAAMQGLLRNPLADGSTMGVSSGAALGAATAILLGISFPGLPISGTMLMAMLFAFLSLLMILSLAYALDRTLSTHTLILIGMIFTMFVHSLMSLILSFAGEKLKTLTFWTLGSLSGSTYENALTLLIALAIGSLVLLGCARELNAFAIGEDNARHLGVPVKRVKLIVLITVSMLIGVCVSIGGTIGFVGLVIPHMARMVTGPNHKRLLPASLFGGACFLMLADLCGRMVLRPIELPIGVVTSLIGAVVFVIIFYRTRKKEAR